MKQIKEVNKKNMTIVSINNEQYNIKAWHEIKIHKDSLYMGSGSRYMPILWDYYNM